MPHMGKIMTQSNFINGQWVNASGDKLVSINPSDNSQLWQGHMATIVEAQNAMSAAKDAFKSWSKTSLEERMECLRRFKDIITERKSEMAQLIAKETGKALWDATGEAGVLAGKVDITIKSYEDRTGAKSFDLAFGRAELIHRPHGVMAVLGPYNFPAHLPNGQILPALLAGNTIVFKPSEMTPAVGAALMQAYHDAGFPPGTVNLVQGGRETAEAMLDHDALAGVLFVGSPQTGAAIHKRFGGRPDIILALEMGGNNPTVAWDVEDYDAAASHIIQSVFITTGQRCTCTRRLIIEQGEAGQRLVDAIVKVASEIKPQSWDSDNSFMGPLISAAGAKRVSQQASRLPGDVILQGQHESGSAFISPHIVDVTGHEVPDEEIFGPVLQIYRVADFDAAIDEANNTKFGLSAGLITSNGKLWDEFKTRIHAGIVNLNRPTTGASGALPFGGPGLSGNHNPGAYYSADFCAWPMASQISDDLNTIAATGLPYKAN